MRVQCVAVSCLVMCAAAVSPAFAQMPPCRIGAVVRSGALNYDAKILEHNDAMGLYRVRYVGAGGGEEWLPASGLKTCAGDPPPPVTSEFFAGTWTLFTGGGGAWEKNASGDWHIKATAVAAAPPLVINRDGTYEWTVAPQKVVRGAWHVAQPSELKYGYDKRGLTLFLAKAYDGANWLVSRDLAYARDGRPAVLIERSDIGLTYWGHKAK